MSIDRETRAELGLSSGTRVTTEVQDGQLIVEAAPEVVQEDG
jgi:hypothetical protein